jgi:hypothetical protein
LLLAIALVAAATGVFASRGSSPGPAPTAGRGGDREPPWGEAVGGWRLRLTGPAGLEYRRNAPLPLLLELRNVSGAPLPLGALAASADPEVSEDGKRLVARPLIDVSPWEGRRDRLPAGATLRWTVYFDRLRFSRHPLKAGSTLQVRFRVLLQSEAPRGAPGARKLRVLVSNAVTLKLGDDHPSVLAGADLPPKWADSMHLVYREQRGLLGYQALRIDGAGRAWLVTVGRGKGRARTPGPVRTEAVLEREHLDRLARFLRDRKVWELAGPGPARLAAPDEGEVRLSIGSAGASLVDSFPERSVRGQPKLLELKAGMEHLMAVVVKEAAVKAARARETPTFPTPPRAGHIKVDFEDVSFSLQPFKLLAVRQPETIRIRGDGICEYRIEGRPARGDEPAWPPAYLEHKLPLKDLRRLETLLKKADWLASRGPVAPRLHASKYTFTLKRKGKTRTIVIEGEPGEPCRSLVTFFSGIALQEYLLYRLERLPGREQQEACREIDLYVRAERGERYSKPLFPIDLRRYAPTFQRYVRNPFDRPTAEVVPAVRLLGHLRIESERPYIAALANDRDQNVRVAVAEALGALGGKESLPVLRRMIHSTDGAAWQLIRLGPLAVPTIVEVIESGSARSSALDPSRHDSQRLIRAYVDHWAEVHRPIDPRVLAAVRKSLAGTKVKGHSTEYHQKLLDLASRPTRPK